MDKFEEILNEVRKLLSDETSGHGFDHVERVYRLALDFNEKEKADRGVVALAAILHDVDDYKIFGADSAEHLTNANRIMDQHKIEESLKDRVIEIIKTMGYNKYLEGVRPKTIEGMIVSDADMCDAIGAGGILRANAYSSSKGNVFFDKDQSPESAIESAAEYRASKSSHSVQHFFDKLLKIPSILMTESGRSEGEKRRAIMIEFLESLFKEYNSKEWLDYLEKYKFNKK